jgi:hypothetical protein
MWKWQWATHRLRDGNANRENNPVQEKCSGEESLILVLQRVLAGYLKARNVGRGKTFDVLFAIVIGGRVAGHLSTIALLSCSSLSDPYLAFYILHQFITKSSIRHSRSHHYLNPMPNASSAALCGPAAMPVLSISEYGNGLTKTKLLLAFGNMIERSRGCLLSRVFRM